MRLIDLKPPKGNLERDALRGLQLQQKSLSPKYLYDRLGSELFEAICELDEYYLTRTEVHLLERAGREIALEFGRNCLLFEFGSGSSLKTPFLLDALECPFAYSPIDISSDMLMNSVANLRARYPDLPIIPIVADFTARMELPDSLLRSATRRAAFFPGSTLGNFEPSQAIDFLMNVHELLGKDGFLAVGIDFEKDRRVLETAYNDSRGITARFNLNLLTRLNKELGADFDLSQFRHFAFYNNRLSRIEMHLESLRSQRVHVAGHLIDFEKGETIHTESSYKFTPARFEALATRTNFKKLRLWTDEAQSFGIYLLCTN